jgi:hypothetical protein
VAAAFNGGFKLTYRDVGFISDGHVAVALKPGLASIVTYTDGTTNIGAWQNGVPTARKTVFSVLQNQQLLVDRGVAAATVTNCVITCWGDTIQNLTTVPRSGLGITATGQLVWGAGEHLTPAELADALVSAGAVRAIELDINPYAVAGYLYAQLSAALRRPALTLPKARDSVQRPSAATRFAAAPTCAGWRAGRADGGVEGRPKTELRRGRARRSQRSSIGPPQRGPGC